MKSKWLQRRAALACVRDVAAACLVLCGVTAAAHADNRTEVTIPGDRAYPESITATSDGTLYTGSIPEGGIFRVRPGSTTAERWIAPGAGDSMSTFGVLADERSGTLWVCSNNASNLGVPPPGAAKPVALKAFDLKTGTLKASHPFPRDPAFCNDAAVGPDGSVYVTDSAQPWVLRLRPGGSALEVWDENQDFGNNATVDGIAFGSDGNLYVNTYRSGQLFRIAIERDGRPGQVTRLQTSQPIEHPDGMRRYGTDTLLMVEGAGRFDIVHLAKGGDSARIEVVKSGYKGPVSVVQVGNTAWVLEGQLDTLFTKGAGKPTPFHAYAVPLRSQ
ncbi:MAG TPA: hypothetical protein VE690_24195 [Rhodopila sp.]|nr:hypothetical protein [Rhodopila sp.]